MTDADLITAVRAVLDATRLEAEKPSLRLYLDTLETRAFYEIYVLFYPDYGKKETDE